MKPPFHAQQRIAIAEACGWTCCGQVQGLNPHGLVPWRKIDDYTTRQVLNHEVPMDTLPDYLNNLNAMHEAEKAFIGDASSAMTFAMYLLRINGQSISTEHDDLNCDHAWIAAHATAAQRAEAFLRTLDKWEKTP
jgi:hypothetical protein